MDETRTSAPISPVDPSTETRGVSEIPVVEALAHPACVFRHPEEVVHHPWFTLPPISFPGRPERWWGDEALKAEADAPQATLEQRHQAAGHVLTLHRRGFFSAGALFSRASHSPVETAQ